MKESFGEYIRRLRKGKDFTLTQLAAKLGIDSSTLSKIETGKKVFDENLLPVLTEVFDLDEKNVKDEYYSEKIANLLFANKCSDEVLKLAAKKTALLRNKKFKQTNIEF